MSLRLPLPSPCAAAVSRRRAWWLGALLCAALAGAACVDGYPTEDEPDINLSDMSPSQLLVALNEVADGPHLNPRRSYRLLSGCQLEVTVQGGASERQRAVGSLAGAEIEALVDWEDRTYDVLLLPTGHPAQPSLTVLEGGKWPDTVHVRSLLQYLQRTCGAGQESPG